MNVVIVDDTQINVTLMQALINRIEGCKPIGFTDSAAGLQWCIDGNPDLVIVDYMMPAPDGIEFIERLRALPAKAEVPILMVTADHEKEVRYRALETGANDFLTKPIDRIEFTSRVKNMLAIRRSHVAQDVLGQGRGPASDPVAATGESHHGHHHRQDRERPLRAGRRGTLRGDGRARSPPARRWEDRKIWPEGQFSRPFSGPSGNPRVP